MSSQKRPEDEVDRQLSDVATGPAMPPHLYFHVPFCSSKCSYCDFFSVANAAPGSVEAVFTGMRAEVHQWGTTCLPGIVETVYVGGGTPSLHAAAVARLLEVAHQRLAIRDGAEITVEANPDSLSSEAIELLAAAGVTRISVGVQSFDDSVLQVLGRRHDAQKALDACALVRSADLDLAVDLICGCPTPASDHHVSWQRSLFHVLETEAMHVSVYPLQVEQGTPLADGVAAGSFVPLGDDEVADELEYASQWLETAGLPRYEIANYAVPGHESRHNTAYWSGASYIGIGPGAHSMLDRATALAAGYRDASVDASGYRWRYAAPMSVEAWLTGAEPTIEVLGGTEAAREDVMLGLRLTRGVPEALVGRAGSAVAIESLARDGLVELVGPGSDRRWRMTARGWLLGNEVFGRVWNAED